MPVGTGDLQGLAILPGTHGEHGHALTVSDVGLQPQVHEPSPANRV